MDECSKIIILDGEHSIPQGNLNKKLSALKNGGFQGKESRCSEIVGPQTGGVVSLNLFQPLIETEGGRRGRRLIHQPWLWGINICRVRLLFGFCFTFEGWGSKQQEYLAAAWLELWFPTLLLAHSPQGHIQPSPPLPHLPTAL